MKKASLVVLSLAVAGLFAASASAFDIGGAVKSAAKDVAKDVGKMVVLKETNKKIAELASQCKCNVKTGEVTNCDYGAIKSTVNPVRKGLKTALNRDADFYVYAASQECASQVQTNVTGWWTWHTAKNSDLKSTVKMELQ